MKHYKDKDNVVYGYKHSEDCVEITLEEVQELLSPSKEELEIQRIQAIKSKAGELINSKYPSYKQLNVLRVGGAELEAMTAYIDGIRTISNEAESNGTKVEDVQWL